jgi:hypothetical protein
MERETNINIDMLPSASPVLPRSWTHSNNPKPATKHDAAPRATTIIYASPPSLTNKTRAKGQSLGDAFASLTAADVDRSMDMMSAVDTGLRNAAQRDDYENALMNDEAALIAQGFYGRSENEDW